MEPVASKTDKNYALSDVNLTKILKCTYYVYLHKKKTQPPEILDSDITCLKP